MRSYLSESVGLVGLGPETGHSLARMKVEVNKSWGSRVYYERLVAFLGE